MPPVNMVLDVSPPIRSAVELMLKLLGRLVIVPRLRRLYFESTSPMVMAWVAVFTDGEMITAGADPSVLILAGAVVEFVPAGPAIRIPPSTLPPTISALPAAGLILVVEGVSVPAAVSVSLSCSDPA